MVKVVCWNIAKKPEPWHCLVKMAERGEADVAILQEAGHVPGDLIETLDVDDKVFWHPMGFDRLPLVVKLSDKVTVEPYRQVPLLQRLPANAIGVSDIGTIAAAKVTPVDEPDQAFVAVSMYARWLRSHPGAPADWIVSTNSAHRIICDLATFIAGHKVRHRILAAGDLNMFYGAVGKKLAVPVWERTVWDRMQALGLVFMGPQQPYGRPPEPGIEPVDVPPDTKNVPTFYYKSKKETPREAANQLDYVFASRGFHEQVTTRAMNGVEEWGPSDHCRLMITVAKNSPERWLCRRSMRAQLADSLTQ